MMPFVHLEVHSNHSFLEGADTPEHMVAAAARQGMPAVALTDTDGLYAAVPFARACREHGLRPVYGVTLTDPSSAARERFGGSREAVLLARDDAGYRAVCEVVTRRHLSEDFSWEEEVASLPEEVMVLVSDEVVLGRRVANRRLREATRVPLPGWTGPVYCRERERRLEVASLAGVRVVAVNGVRFVSRAGHEVHRLLVALRSRATMGTVPREQVASPEAYLASPEEMAMRFRSVPEAVREGVRVAAECRVDLELGTRKFPAFPVPGGGDADRYLRGLALAGLSERYAGADLEAARRVLERELAVIRTLGLADYVLICHDIVQFARSRHIPCLGRGSAADSIVSYCLYITHVDPIAHNLYFERFLNEQRVSPPDFDLDFGTEDRERILAYIFDRYGRDKVAMIGMHVTFQVRGAFREVAAALGIPRGEVDAFIKRLPHVSDLEHLPENLQTSPETRNLPLGEEPFRSVFRLARRIGGFPRYVATHPCGLVIAPEPICRYMPLQRGDKGLVVTQWSMYPVEDAGLLKIDILGQKGLEVISRAGEAARRQGHAVLDSPGDCLRDRRTREWLREGRTIGCFYIESPAMIALIRQARCDDFECLTALSSIIRPGVSSFGGKLTYLRRRLKLEPEQVLHPLLEPILRDTKGCLIYQEQVIRIAAELAGLTLGEADDLRRVMSFKRERKRLADYREKFYAGCRAKGLPEPVIDEVYRAVESFAGYAFCKAHSASFALESFESMYYKSHFPAEFMAAVLSGGGGYYSNSEYLEEARRLGVTIHPPCINGSMYRTEGAAGRIRIGLMHVKALRKTTAVRIIEQRRAEGPFRNLLDFVRRVRPAECEIRNLVKCGALRSLGHTIPEMLWGVAILYRQGFSGNRIDEKIHALLSEIPMMPDPPPAERLRLEQDILGMTPSGHPFRMFPREIARVRRLRPVVRSVDLASRSGSDAYVLGWRVTGKQTRTRDSGRLMAFFTFSDEWGRFETVFFPEMFQRFALELRRGRGPFLLKGRVETQFGEPTLTAHHVKLLSNIPRPRWIPASNRR